MLVMHFSSELVTMCILTMLGALEVVRTAYCAL